MDCCDGGGRRHPFLALRWLRLEHCGAQIVASHHVKLGRHARAKPHRATEQTSASAFLQLHLPSQPKSHISAMPITHTQLAHWMPSLASGPRTSPGGVCFHEGLSFNVALIYLYVNFHSKAGSYGSVLSPHGSR